MKIIVIKVMEFVDIHTHKLPEEPQNSLHGKIITVVNCSPKADIDRFEYCSVGIHPWNVTKNWQDDFEILKKQVLQPQVVAIGECGLDKLRGGEWSLQKACFQAQIDLAKQTGKPLVLHCVKAVDEVIRMCVGVKCIFHGFRGKPEQAKQLLQKGFDLSFGEKFNADSLTLAWQVGRMWLETDESECTIEQIYQQVAKALRISPTDIVVPGTIKL